MQIDQPRAAGSPLPPMPENREAEESVVGGILFQGRALALVAELLEPGDFYHPACQAIYEAFLALDQAGRPIDIITVAEQMRGADTFCKLLAQGGEAYLAELSSRVATVENLPHHARIVRGKATLRATILAAGQLRDGAFFAPDADEHLERVQQRVLELTLRTTQAPYSPVRPVLNKVIKSLEGRYNAKEAITGVASGYTKVDEMTAGFQPGDLIIIAARPSMGKTSFVMNCAQHAALGPKIPVLVFSLEMNKESLVERLLCAEARVDSQRLRSGFLETRDWINVTKAAALISEAPIFIDDAGAPTLLEIRAKARRWRGDPKAFAPGGPALGMIVVDYLQLIQGRGGKDSSREREISEISRGLKALAKELRVPVVALSQLNRSVESRQDKRPMLSDLRESGAIEQDADLICFIYRDEVYVKDSPDRGIAEIIIGKQRSGPTGTVRLTFLNQYTRFENLALGRN